jgi:hypothetical protein
MLRACAQFVFIALVASATASPADKLLGSWKWDDGKGYSEIQFRADNTFTWFNRLSVKNRELVLSAMTEISGRWLIDGNRLTLDGTERPYKESFRGSLRFSVNDGRLRVQRASGGSKVDTYTRFRLARCEPSMGPNQALEARDLIGRWRGHYRTHDSEFIFRQHGIGALYALDAAKPMKVFDLIWNLSGNVLMMRQPHGKISEDEGILWEITAFFGNCFTVRHGSMTYTFVRTKDRI